MRKKRRKIKHWSYSSWATWKGCAYKWYRTRILGEKEPMGYPVQRGIAIHAKAEAYLKGKLTGPPPRELGQLRDLYQRLRARKPIVEEFWCVDSNWRPVKSMEKAWCVMKMDAALPPTKREPTLWIQDTKTGKEYDSHLKQGELYACIGAVKVSQAVGVDVEFWYTDSGYSQPYHFTPRQIQRLTDWWIGQGEAMMSEKDFLPTPTIDGCRWCFLRSDKGGPCRAWKVAQLR